jgi:dTDP-glucose 4,6-dehydratase
MKILVTGGAGFIGSAFIRRLMARRSLRKLINLDKLTYAGHLEGLRSCEKDPRYTFVKGDIASPAVVERWMAGVDAVVNFAAETHVDRSIHDAAPFLHTNVIGTQVLLEAAKKFRIRRFVHVSTDEVYGSIERGFPAESASLHPASPYSASKASSDHLVMAYHLTYGLPTIITRAANNYGPYQYPEKFLPLFITHAIENRPLPLYGDGLNVRDWLHVDDHCAAIEVVLKRGQPGGIYNIGTGRGFTNLAVAKKLLRYLGKTESLIKFVKDRPGHDRRYAMSIEKIERELDWSPSVRFEDGLRQLADWYVANTQWWKSILNKSKSYQQYYDKQYVGRAGKPVRETLLHS